MSIKDNPDLTATSNGILYNTQQGEKASLLRLSPRKPRNMKNLSLDLGEEAQKDKFQTPTTDDSRQRSVTISHIESSPNAQRLAPKLTTPPTLFRSRTGSSSLPFRHPSLSIHRPSAGSSEASLPDMADGTRPGLQRRRTTLLLTIPKSKDSSISTKRGNNSPTTLITPSLAPHDFPPVMDQMTLSILNMNINMLNIDLSGSSYRPGAYPDGPACIIEPNLLYLYSEPTLDQISKFDLVINCAKELKDYTSQVLELPTPNNTEYVFIPWTHTSHLVQDLPGLMSKIEKHFNQNHRILIHCQCGVSRSLSLVVLFIMKLKNLNLNDLYNEVKLKLPLISPNMTLIFQLMEWNNILQGNNSNLTSPIVEKSLNNDK